MNNNNTTSAEILITNRPDCWYELPETNPPAVFFVKGMPLSIELHTQPAFAAISIETRSGMTAETVRSAVAVAAQDTFLRTVVGKKLLLADIAAMELLVELLDAWKDK